MRYSGLSDHIQVNIFTQEYSVIGNNPHHTWEKSRTKNVVSTDNDDSQCGPISVSVHCQNKVKQKTINILSFSILQLIFTDTSVCMTLRNLFKFMAAIQRILNSWAAYGKYKEADHTNVRYMHYIPTWHKKQWNKKKTSNGEATRLGAGRPKNRGSIPGKSKRFLSLPKRQRQALGSMGLVTNG